MKKIYSKPEIVFESFTLSTNIAGDCDKKVTTYAKDACGITGSDPELVWFSFSADGSNCNAPGTGSEMTNDGFCYHNPSESNNLFNS